MASLTPSSDAEILVHVTAPSRAADDAVYRQLAQAYLEFEPQSRTKIILEEPQADVSRQKPDSALAHPTAPAAIEAASLSFAQSFEINSQNISFSGVVDNRSSPRLRHTPIAQYDAVTPSQEDYLTSQDSWCAPPSQISDSYPMPDQGVFNTSPTRVLRRYIGNSSSRNAPSISSSPPRPPLKKSIPSTQSTRIDVPSSLPDPEDEPESPGIAALGHLKVNQTIPVTPYLPKTTRAPQSSIDSAVLAVDESILDVTHISSSAPTNQAPTPSHRAESAPPPNERHSVAHLQHADLVRSASDTGPIQSSMGSISEEISHSLEIRPPSPPVGVINVDPDDLISEKMAKLAQDLSSRYRPEFRREVDPFERGYWLLDCTSWSPEDRVTAWVFLNNYIRNGVAGWGTWCRRDDGDQWIRLYCWGHVAKHMYLLLYLASKRRLKTTGATWYGADGEVVLEILPYDKQRGSLHSSMHDV